MIVTPEHLIKQFFPEPIATTKDLYNRLELDALGYSYLNWLKDLEKHCLSQYLDDSDYSLLSDSEKNYGINQKAFRIIIQSSPSKIGDQIRACISDIAKKVATDPAFARQLQDQYDQESGIEIVKPKVSKALKSKYNQTGHDAFEFSIEANTRLYMDIISDYNFQPGQKIKDVLFIFKLEVENGVPFHIVDIMLSLTNDHNLTYRTVWCCSEERLRYGSILSNRVIRVNLFEDNKKLVDSYEYILGQSDIKALEAELEKVISMLLDLNLDQIDLNQLKDKILNRHNLNDQAYALAIKEVIPTLTQYLVQSGTDEKDTIFLNAVNQYWEKCVLGPKTADDFADDLDKMIKERIPVVTLALVATDMLNYNDLCDRYFKRSFSNRQRQRLLNDANLRLIYALSAAEFDPAVAPDQRTANVCAFITDQLDLMKNLIMDMGKWPSK